MFLAVTARRCEISCPRRVEFRRRVKFHLKFCFKNIGKSCNAPTNQPINLCVR